MYRGCKCNRVTWLIESSSLFLTFQNVGPQYSSPSMDFQDRFLRDKSKGKNTEAVSRETGGGGHKMDRIIDAHPCEPRRKVCESGWLIIAFSFHLSLPIAAILSSLRLANRAATSVSRATRINLSFSRNRMRKNGAWSYDCVRPQKRRQAAENAQILSPRVTSLLLSLVIAILLLSSASSTSPASFFRPERLMVAFAPVIQRKKRIMNRKCGGQMLNPSAMIFGKQLPTDKASNKAHYICSAD